MAGMVELYKDRKCFWKWEGRIMNIEHRMSNTEYRITKFEVLEGQNTFRRTIPIAISTGSVFLVQLIPEG